MSKLILVTGASGFIGRGTLAPLVDRGFEVHAIARGAPPTRLATPAVRWWEADLLSPGVIEAIVADVKPTHVLHLAWTTTHGKFWADPANLDWVGVTLALARSFALHGGERFIGVGTGFEYAPSDDPCDEARTPLAPSTLYGTAKATTFTLLTSFAREAAFQFAWPRVFHLYGPGEGERRLVPVVIDALLRSEPAKVTDGRQRRDFMHVEDISRAIAAIADSAVTGGINVGSGEPVDLREVVAEIARQLSGEQWVRYGAYPTPAHDPAVLVPNVERLTREVGYRRRYSLAEGIADSIAARRTKIAKA